MRKKSILLTNFKNEEKETIENKTRNGWEILSGKKKENLKNDDEQIWKTILVNLVMDCEREFYSRI